MEVAIENCFNANISWLKKTEYTNNICESMTSFHQAIPRLLSICLLLVWITFQVGLCKKNVLYSTVSFSIKFYFYHILPRTVKIQIDFRVNHDLVFISCFTRNTYLLVIFFKHKSYILDRRHLIYP